MTEEVQPRTTAAIVRLPACENAKKGALATVRAAEKGDADVQKLLVGSQPAHVHLRDLTTLKKCVAKNRDVGTDLRRTRAEPRTVSQEAEADGNGVPTGYTMFKLVHPEHTWPHTLPHTGKYTHTRAYTNKLAHEHTCTLTHPLKYTKPVAASTQTTLEDYTGKDPRMYMYSCYTRSDNS